MKRHRRTRLLQSVGLGTLLNHKEQDRLEASSDFTIECIEGLCDYKQKDLKEAVMDVHEQVVWSKYRYRGKAKGEAMLRR